MAAALLEPIRYADGQLHVLNQLKLPLESVYDECQGTEDGWKAIKVSLAVRRSRSRFWPLPDTQGLPLQPGYSTRQML